MGREIYVQDLPADVEDVSDVPEDFEPRSLGRREDVIEAILAVAPSADASDPAWVVVDEGAFRVEFNLGEDEELFSFAVNVDDDEGAAHLVARLLERLELRALDPSCPTGLFEPPVDGGAH